jgi:histidinol-phosphate aminotransferase
MTSPNHDRIPYLPPLYRPGHQPGTVRIDPSWAYVPPVRPGFALNLDREETTDYRGILPADADERRRREFPIQNPNRYPSRLIEAALGERIAADLGVAPNQVLLGNGVMSVMTYLYEIYSTALGDIVVPTPGFWPAYTYAMQRARGIWMPLYVQDDRQARNPSFVFPVEAIREALSHGAGLCYLCNPNNPTGTLLPFDDVEALVREFPATLFILDEAYGPFAANLLNDEEFELRRGMKLVRDGCENLVVCRTFSKSYAMANLRIGYIVSHPANVLTVKAHMGPYDIDELSVAIAYYNYTEDAYMRDTVRAVVANKRLYEGMLDSLGVTHYGGYRNSILVTPLEIGQSYESRGIAVRSMVYQQGIPNPIAHTFRITIPSDARNMALLTEVTNAILLAGSARP